MDEDLLMKPCGFGCGLLLRPDEKHPALVDCIEALKAALVKQRYAATTLAFDISAQYLRVLEELALEAANTRVSSLVSAAVVEKMQQRFREMGDWTPLTDAREEVRELRAFATQCLIALDNVYTKRVAAEVSRDQLDHLATLRGFATRLGVPQPDLRRS